jgi:hypothetical protein
MPANKDIVLPSDKPPKLTQQDFIRNIRQNDTNGLLKAIPDEVILNQAFELMPEFKNQVISDTDPKLISQPHRFLPTTSRVPEGVPTQDTGSAMMAGLKGGLGYFKGMVTGLGSMASDAFSNTVNPPDPRVLPTVDRSKLMTLGDIQDFLKTELPVRSEPLKRIIHAGSEPFEFGSKLGEDIGTPGLLAFTGEYGPGLARGGMSKIGPSVERLGKMVPAGPDINDLNIAQLLSPGGAGILKNAAFNKILSRVGPSAEKLGRWMQSFGEPSEQPSSSLGTRTDTGSRMMGELRPPGMTRSLPNARTDTLTLRAPAPIQTPRSTGTSSETPLASNEPTYSTLTTKEAETLKTPRSTGTSSETPKSTPEAQMLNRPNTTTSQTMKYQPKYNYAIEKRWDPKGKQWINVLVPKGE